MLHAVVHGADIQVRDGGVMVMATLFGLYPCLRKLYADVGYQGHLSDDPRDHCGLAYQSILRLQMVHAAARVRMAAHAARDGAFHYPRPNGRTCSARQQDRSARSVVFSRMPRD